MHPIDQRISYDATSYTNYRTDADISGLFRSWYLRLPEGSNPRTADLARQLHESSSSDQEFINTVLRKFHEEEFFYTLEPPPLGNNPVDRFLFDTRRGFCEHYASAFAVMMRSAGLPARIVLGYQGGELNPMGGHLIVRQADAHAWTEVWLEGIGWHRVDPTAAVAPERIEVGRSAAMFNGIGLAWGLSAPSELLHQLKLTIDAIDAKWNEWILGYGPENQNRFLEWLGMDDPDWRKKMLTLVGAVIGLVLLISLLLMLRYRQPRKDRAAVLYSRFTSKAGLEPLLGETPAAYAYRAQTSSPIPANTIDAITSTYLSARYGPDDPTMMNRLELAVAKLRRE